jgi:hypothetical protein
MSRSRAVRIAAVAVVGLAAGAAAWRGLEPIGPSLEVATRLEMRMDAYEIWNVVVKVRGGERIDEVRVEPASGPTRVVTAPVHGLRSGLTTTFRVQVDGNRAPDASVRVVQTGRVSNAYLAPLVEKP